jgi:4-amino-4-deoxychorismate lyase
MCRFIETIKFIDGNFQNPGLHNARMNKTRSDVFGSDDIIDLTGRLSCPQELNGIVKCRITYSQNIESVDYSRYFMRSINSLKITLSNDIEYSYKYEDRKNLAMLFDMRRHCDEILIVKDGAITDTSFSNVVFFDGEKWMTPEYPLLNGIKRQALLDEKKIFEGNITPDDLEKYEKVSLINAMLDIGDIEVSIKNIFL